MEPSLSNYFIQALMLPSRLRCQQAAAASAVVAAETVAGDAIEAAADPGVEAVTANAVGEARPGRPRGLTPEEGLTRESETKIAAATRSPEDLIEIFANYIFFVFHKQ